jgi:methionyl-tRNA formyltransferase
MQKVIVLISLLTMYASAANELAMEPTAAVDTSAQIEKKNKTDNIFDEIMQSLPENVKVQLDSIKTTSTSQSTPDIKSRNIVKDKKLYIDNVQKQKQNEMSDELKTKIEKAMKEIEKNKIRKQIEFKENKKGNQK